MKKHLTLLLKIGIAAGLLYYLYTSKKLRIENYTNLLDVWKITTLLVLVGLSLAFAGYRWKKILDSQNLNLSIFEVTRLTLIGLFFSFILPGGVSGDLIKGYYVAKKFPENRAAAATTILLDRLFGLFAMLSMAVVSMVIFHEDVMISETLRSIFYLLLAIFAGFCLFWCLAFSHRVNSSKPITQLIQKIKIPVFQKIYFSVSVYREKKSEFFRALAISFMAQSMSVLFFIAAASFLDFNLPISGYFFVIPIGFILTAIPISPAGIGVGQVAFDYLFHISIESSHLTNATNPGISCITLFQIGQLAMALVGLVFYVSYNAKERDLTIST